MYDGFSTWEGNCVLWVVIHDHGSTHVRATTEAIALQRFVAKYPNYSVREIRRV